MNAWRKNAEFIEKTFGGYVDWDEEFYLCPYCGEPIYRSDWSEQELALNLCCVCEDWDDKCEHDDEEEDN